MTTGDELGVLPAWRGDSPTGAKEAKYFCWRGLDDPDQIELPMKLQFTSAQFSHLQTRRRLELSLRTRVLWGGAKCHEAARLNFWAMPLSPFISSPIWCSKPWPFPYQRGLDACKFCDR